jgi:prepilin-type N-terminal cleavage/methylation domain-containing protein
MFRPSRLSLRSRTALRARLDDRRAFTLVEVLVASLVLAALVGGVLATLLQSRNLTEGSIYQNSANTILQGYIEQIKNMEFADLPYTAGGTLMPGSVAGAASTLLTRGVRRVSAADGAMENIADPLLISTSASIPLPAEILNNALPAGVVDNIKLFDINNTPDNPADDLRLRIWIWIRDLSDPSSDATNVRGITILYSWRANNGSSNARSFVGTVRTIRSAVPTF